jgi:hypothetical protein
MVGQIGMAVKVLRMLLKKKVLVRKVVRGFCVRCMVFLKLWKKGPYLR